MAIVRNNDELLEAALVEINKLPTDEQLKQDDTAEIPYLLASQQRLLGDVDSEARIYAHALHADPSSAKARAEYETALSHDTDEGDESDQGTSDGARRAMEHRIHRQPWLAQVR